jgi:hypothetical protein
MAAAAQAFLQTLGEEQRAKAFYPFEDEERHNWHFIPRERNGLPFKEMTEAQREAAHALLKQGLSAQGYSRAMDVMTLEGILGQLEGRPEHRDPENYFLTVFGQPGADTPWGWRLEGHHLSLNYTAATHELVASTPAFMGSNPAEVRSGDRTGWRVLGTEEDLGRTLVMALDEQQRARALIAEAAPEEIITAADRSVKLESFEGLPASEMTEVQRKLLQQILEVYIDKMDADLAASHWQKLEEHGLDALYFAWAGSTELGEAHYYRVHGPSLLIEYDNTQNEANHAHTVLRDPEGDFGEDLLREHYEHAH